MSQKPYVGEVTLSLGPMEVVGGIYPPKVTNANADVKLISVCPACTEVHLVSQFYQCTEDRDHIYKQGELDKAKETEDGLVRVSREESQEARKSELEKNILEINVHARSDIEGKTLEAGTTYVYRPKTASKFYGVLIDLLDRRPDLVLMGHMNLRDKDKLMRVTRGLNGQLILTEMMWPEEVDQYAAPEYEYKPSLLDVAEKLIEESIVPFDGEEYKRAEKERINALVESKASGQPMPKTTKKSKMNDDDSLEEALLAALSAKAS